MGTKSAHHGNYICQHIILVTCLILPKGEVRRTLTKEVKNIRGMDKKRTHITLSDFVNVYTSFKERLIYYCLDRKMLSSEIRSILHITEQMLLKAEYDTDYRDRVYVWMQGLASTIVLREICKIVGYNYWNDLDTANKIDTLDSFHCIEFNHY